MMKLLVTTSATKELVSLPKPFKARVENKIEGLIDDPFPPGFKKLTGRNGYRIRFGDYRVLYVVNKKRGEIIVLSVKHRKDAYRR